MAVVELTAHPASPSGPPERVTVAVDWLPQSRRLELEYRLLGDAGLLRLPAPVMPVRADGLWRHTCCEAFVRPAGGQAYCEFNFSPSGAWAAWRFHAPRRDMQPIAGLDPPRTQLTRIAAGFLLEVALDLGPVDSLPPEQGLELGLAAVIEDQQGRQSFWALHHPADQPDFHDPAAFALRLDAVNGRPGEDSRA